MSYLALHGGQIASTLGVPEVFLYRENTFVTGYFGKNAGYPLFIITF